ncbi:MAG: FkbM family methyltransferase, partial [Chitinophagales bacterium]|nr:FkbM family methyltransferase [Chitinophagales bacterium]
MCSNLLAPNQSKIFYRAVIKARRAQQKMSRICLFRPVNFVHYLRLLHRAYRYKYRHEPGGVRFLYRHLRPGDTALDIGAHKGAYVYWMQKITGARGKVFAFEPQHNLYLRLQQLVRYAHWQQVTVENLALHHHEGMGQLFIPAGLPDGSSPGARIFPTEVTEPGAWQQVQTTTLDAYCTLHGLLPDFLKIDVEGNEWNVLTGGEHTIRLHRPVLMIEIEARHVGEDRARETFAWLQQHGYEGFALSARRDIPL